MNGVIVLFMGAVYFVVILLACVLGAIVGLGGGVFIRPIFDAIGYHEVLDIQFFSSSAILTMAIVSTVKKIRDGTKIDIGKALAISLGAVAGGTFGNIVLERMIYVSEIASRVQVIQSIATIAVLIVSLILTNVSKRFEIKNKAVSAAVGVFLGAAAVFLGIGGGPVNVPIFMIFFGLPIKTATAYSIVIIFFSHLSRLATLGFTVGYSAFDLSLLPLVIIAAAIGGLFGARLSKIFTDKTVKRLFQLAISAVILLNLYNVIFVFG